MRVAIRWAAWLTGFVVSPLIAQTVVDRIVARVEDDIIAWSDVRELGRYQELLGRHAASEDELLNLLIDQWIVNAEASAGQFPLPAESEITQEKERIEKSLGGAKTCRARMREVGLSEAAFDALVTRQLYLTRYLDYKFRPTARVSDKEIETYYREELGPSLAKRGETPPALDAVRETVRELLIQREISARASTWMKESRQRLKIEIRPPR